MPLVALVTFLELVNFFARLSRAVRVDCDLLQDVVDDGLLFALTDPNQFHDLGVGHRTDAEKMNQAMLKLILSANVGCNDKYNLKWIPTIDI